MSEIRFWGFWAVMLLIVGGLFTGCYKAHTRMTEETPVRGKILNVQRIYMHEPHNYSVQWREGDLIETKRFVAPITIKADATNNLWVEYMGGKSIRDNIRYSKVIFHVWSAEDINVAGSVPTKDRRSTMNHVLATDPKAAQGSHQFDDGTK